MEAKSPGCPEKRDQGTVWNVSLQRSETGQASP